MSPFESSDVEQRETDSPIFNGLTVDSSTLKEIEQIESQGYGLFQTGTPGDPSFRDAMNDAKRLERDYRHAQGNAINQQGEPVTIDLLFFKN